MFLNRLLFLINYSKANKRKQVITQKYISFVGNPIEAYYDYRRTGYPQLAVALNSTGDDPATGESFSNAIAEIRLLFNLSSGHPYMMTRFVFFIVQGWHGGKINIPAFRFIFLRGRLPFVMFRYIMDR